MAELTRRLQVLLDEERHRRLEEEAEANGASIGALIREAIDRAYPRVTLAQRNAAAEFLRMAEEDPLPVVEWETEKHRFRDEMFRVSRHGH